jgi:hypothetical protein
MLGAGDNFIKLPLSTPGDHDSFRSSHDPDASHRLLEKWR